MLIAWLLLLQVASPPVGVEVFRSESGLNANALYGVLVDPNGFVWVNTDNGLYRYDGNTFRVVPATLGREVILANMVDSVTIAALSFDNSIELIDIRRLGSSETLQIPDSIKLNSFASTVRRFGDTLYVGTSERRLLRNVGSSWENFEFMSNRHLLERVTLITQGQYGPMITSTIGTLKISNGSLVPSDTTTQPSSKPTFTQGEWWIAGRRKLHVVRGGVLESPISLSDIGIKGYVNQMIWRSKDELWLASQQEGLVVARRTSRGVWEKQTLLSMSNISGLSIDATGAIWVTTLNNGLYRFQSWFDRFESIPNLPTKGKTIFAAPDYVVGEFDGAFTLSNGRGAWIPIAQGLIHYAENIGLDTLIIGQIYETRLFSGGRWSENLQDIIRSNGLNLQPPIKHAHRYRGRLAVASPNGVYVFSASSLEMVRHFNRRSTAVILLDDDRIAIGRPDRLEVWSLESGQRLFSSNLPVTSMVAVDSHRILVASSSAGLQLFDAQDNRLQNVLTAEGARTTRWNAIFRLNQNRFALVGAKGLYFIERSDSTTWSHLIEIPMTPDGFAQSIRHVHLDEQGDVWFSTSEGILRARLEDLLDQPILPSIRLSEIRVDNEEFVTQEHINLNSKQNRIFIGIATLGLKNPRSVILEYRFGDVASPWIPLSQPAIEIESIRKGTTVFEFRLRNVLTDEVVSSVSLNVWKQPHWWELTWVIVLAVMLALSATVGLTLFTQRHLHRRKLERLAQEDKMREYERVAVTRLLTSHYLFNALATIRSVARRSTDEVNSYIGRLSKVIRALIDRTSQNDVDLQSELDWIRDYVALESVGRQINIEFAVSMDEILDPKETYIPAFILQPVVENAMFHGSLKEDPVIRCDIRLVNDHLRIFIRNRIAPGQTPSNPTHTSSRGLQFMTERLRGWGRYHGFALENDDVLSTRFTESEWSTEIILPFINHELPLVTRA